MKYKFIVKIDLKDFFLTGKFDIVKLEMTKDYIYNNFPSMNDLSISGNITLNNGIEFHFDQDKLFLIWCDDFKRIYSDENIQIETQILKLKINDFLNLFLDEKVDYSVLNQDEERKIIVSKSNILLYFDYLGNLTAFGKKKY